MLAQGKTAREAYLAAGYADRPRNAAKLKKTAAVRTRLRELQSPAAAPDAASATTVESLIGELERVRASAMADGQANAAISAILGIAKLQGLAGEPRKPGTVDDALQTFDLSHITDAQLATLEAIFGPLAAAGAGDGGDRDGEGA